LAGHGWFNIDGANFELFNQHLALIVNPLGHLEDVAAPSEYRGHGELPERGLVVGDAFGVA
jgi:hypothetical protein